MGKLEQRKLKEINFINLFGLLREMKKKNEWKVEKLGGYLPHLTSPKHKIYYY